MVRPILLIALITMFLLQIGCDTEPTAVYEAEQVNQAPGEQEPEPVPPVDEDGFALTLTNGYTGCFQQFDVNGSVDGRITAVVDSTGAVPEVSYSGSAPDPVQACIIDLVKARQIDGYGGEPGLAQFTYSGTYSGGIEMLSTSWAFKRYSDLPEDAQGVLQDYMSAEVADDDDADEEVE
jgi:hypothetical protein